MNQDEQAIISHLPELTEQFGIEHIQPLLARFSVQRMSSGEVLFRDREHIEAFHLVLSGRLSLAVELDGHSVLLGDMGPGNWCGELAYFSGTRCSSSTVTALEDTELARLGFNDFETMMAEDTLAACQLTHAFNEMMMHRLDVTAENPVIDPQGQMLIMGDLSLPRPGTKLQHHSVKELITHLFGVR